MTIKVLVRLCTIQYSIKVLNILTLTMSLDIIFTITLPFARSSMQIADLIRVTFNLAISFSCSTLDAFYNSYTSF